MTERPSEDERALAQLFDDTSTRPAQASLDRLGRHAATLPEQPHRRGWWRWAGVLALGLSAATALALWWPTRGSQDRALASAKPGAATGGQLPPRQPSSPWQPADDEEAWALLAEDGERIEGASEGDERVALFDADADDALSGLELLSLSVEEEHLDALEDALDGLLEGG